MSEMKKALLAALIISTLLVSLLIGIQTLIMVEGNFVPPNPDVSVLNQNINVIILNSGNKILAQVTTNTYSTTKTHP